MIKETRNPLKKKDVTCCFRSVVHEQKGGEIILGFSYQSAAFAIQLTNIELSALLCAKMTGTTTTSFLIPATTPVSPISTRGYHMVLK